jgi:hypothetical protein
LRTINKHLPFFIAIYGRSPNSYFPMNGQIYQSR